MSPGRGRKGRQKRARRWDAAVNRIGRRLDNGVKALVVSDCRSGESPWIDDLAKQLSADGLMRCEHLQGRSGGGFIRPPEMYGRCLACSMEHVAAESKRVLLESGSVAEPCGRCGATTDPGTLRPVAVELGSWVVVSALCSVCAAVLLHEGQRGSGLASVADGVR